MVELNNKTFTYADAYTYNNWNKIKDVKLTVSKNVFGEDINNDYCLEY